jgi:hypothetical protein
VERLAGFDRRQNVRGQQEYDAPALRSVAAMIGWARGMARNFFVIENWMAYFFQLCKKMRTDAKPKPIMSVYMAKWCAIQGSNL